MSVPNILSVFRIVLIPVFVVSYLQLSSEQMYISAAILVLSGLTDVVDGYVARRFNMVTQLGKVLDPFADKLTLAAVCATLAVRYPTLIPLLIIYVAKELCMLIGGIIIWKSGIRIQSSKWFGKFATVVFYIAMFYIILFPDISTSLLIGIMIVLVAVVLFSFVMYIQEFLLIKRENHK